MGDHRPLRAPVVAALLAGAALAAACTGTIGGDPIGDRSNSDPSCVAPTPGAALVRRLTQAQYNNTVRDLLGDTTHPADSFPPDETAGTFSNNASSQTVSPLLAQGYQQAAEALAAQAVTNKAKLLPCDPSKGEDSCVRQFVQTFGKRAYRRVLTSAEIDALVALYTTNRQGATFDNGIQAVLEAVLNSASFLYLPEYGLPDQAKSGVVQLAPYEMASRLSYFLWNSMPDDALLEAADAGQLATIEQVVAQARRMVADSKARDATREFFDQWLSVKELESAGKDATTYPDYSSALRSSMLTETRAFLDHVMWQSDGRVETLLTAPFSFLDANTAKIYGVQAGGPLQKTDLDPTQRAGVLTQPSLLAIFAKPNQSSPVQRGKFVRERFLCHPLPAPPPNLVTAPPEVKPGSTTRERFAEHDKDPACAGCHTLMDPIGFGFEHYDGIGKYRTTDQGISVNATGSVSASDVDGPFDGAPELARKLAQSETVKGCIATQWFRYTMGRGETDADKCSLSSATQAFAAAKYDMRELLVAITVTDAFRYRMEVKP